MPSLKDLRNRIASTKATQKITKAMQMVAASKLRRAQAAAEAARPFAERMEAVLQNIASGMADLKPSTTLAMPAASLRQGIRTATLRCGSFTVALVVRISTSDYGESARVQEAVWFTFCRPGAARMPPRADRRSPAAMSVHQAIS